MFVVRKRDGWDAARTNVMVMVGEGVPPSLFISFFLFLLFSSLVALDAPSHLISSHLISPHLIASHFTSSHLISSHFASSLYVRIFDRIVMALVRLFRI